MTGTILTIVGLLATVIFGVIPLYRKFRYPAKVTFVKESAISLFDSIVRNLPDLKMTYKEAPVSQELILIRGAILNEGFKDITESMTEQPLKLNLPKGYKWLTAQVISASKNVTVDIDIENERALVFRIGLFRCREYIRFEALAECPSLETATEKPIPDRKNIEEVMYFTHRIADTENKVNKMDLLPRANPRVKKRIVLLSVIPAGVTLATLIFIIFFGNRMFLGLSYSFKVESGDYIEVIASPKANGMIKIKGVSAKYSNSISPDQFFSQCGKLNISENKKEKHFFTIANLIYLIIFSFPLISTYLRRRKNKKLRQLLSIEE